jgi:hypothetical protein
MDNDDDRRDCSRDTLPSAVIPYTEPPQGCGHCLLGVRIDDGNRVRACLECARAGRGYRSDVDAAGFIGDSLAGLADVAALLWPHGDPEAAWSADTIDAIAHRLEFLRTTDSDRTPEAVRYSGDVRIELNFDDSDRCYDGKVIVDDHVYSFAVFGPAFVDPRVAFDSAEGFDRAAHAALSFAAADKKWAEGRDIFTPAAEVGPDGWVISRRRPVVATDDRTSYYRRSLSRHLEQAGWARVDRRLANDEVPSRDDPTRRREVIWAWLRDALLWSLEELADGRPLYAFRGLLQAAGYAAEVGNDVTTSDAMSFLRNAIEDVITGRDAP